MRGKFDPEHFGIGAQCSCVSSAQRCANSIAYGGDGELDKPVAFFTTTSIAFVSWTCPDAGGVKKLRRYLEPGARILSEALSSTAIHRSPAEIRTVFVPTSTKSRARNTRFLRLLGLESPGCLRIMLQDKTRSRLFLKDRRTEFIEAKELKDPLAVEVEHSQIIGLVQTVSTA